jgi:hypothetical protein
MMINKFSPLSVFCIFENKSADEMTYYQQRQAEDTMKQHHHACVLAIAHADVFAAAFEKKRHKTLSCCHLAPLLFSEI